MNSDITQIYEELALKHNAAYAAFRTMYEAKTPMPNKGKGGYDGWYILLALVVMVVASIIVSGSRTVEEFGGGVIGFSAFVMLEGAIVTYAFFRTRTGFDEARIEDVRKLAKRGLMLAFGVAVAANIHAVLKAHGIVMSSYVVTIINLFVAISAPTLAFISGDVMALETMRITNRKRRIETDYQDKLDAWAEALNKSWQGQQSKWGVKIEVENERTVIPKADTGSRSLSALSEADGQRTDSGHGYGTGYTKRTDARTRVVEHLEAYPADMVIPVRELAEKLGVGKTTVYDVMKSMKG